MAQSAHCGRFVITVRDGLFATHYARKARDLPLERPEKSREAIMDSIPSWAIRLVNVADEFLELQGHGTLEWRWCEAEDQLHFAPGLVELVGGAEDGEMIYPFLAVNLSALLLEFDATPSMEWDTMHDELWVGGTVQEKEAFLVIRKEPFSDALEAGHVLDQNARLREKKQLEG